MFTSNDTGYIQSAGETRERPDTAHRMERECPLGTVPFGQRIRERRSKDRLPSKTALENGLALTGRHRTRTQTGRQTGRESARSGYSQTGRSVRSQTARSTGRVDVGEEGRDLIVRFIRNNGNRINLLDPSLLGLTENESVAILEDKCDKAYDGNFKQFFEDMKKDERELRLRDSKSVEAAIRPRDQDYEPPVDYRMDGYETYRKKHHDQIYRIMAHPAKPTCEYEGFMASGSFRRTKGNIAGYGNFSGWQNIYKSNETAMLNR